MQRIMFLTRSTCRNGSTNVLSQKPTRQQPSNTWHSLLSNPDVKSSCFRALSLVQLEVVPNKILLMSRNPVQEKNAKCDIVTQANTVNKQFYHECTYETWF